MPSAGGVCPPVITPLRENYDGKSCSNISSDTYVELETETPECKIYFTTDGSKPLPYQSKFTDGKSTFIYKGPFHLKPGKRTLKALAVTRDGLKESDVVTKTFSVKEPKERGSDVAQVPHLGKFKSRSKKNHAVVSSSSSSSSSCETLNIHEVDNTNHKTQLQSYSNGFEMPHASFSPQNSPFNPQSHSGTQINLWGFPPPQIPPWSAGGIPNSFYSLPRPHLGYMTTRALENLNQPKLPLHELKKIIREEGDRLLVKNTQMQFHLANQIKQNEVNEMQKQEPKSFYANGSQSNILTETSPGHGNWQGQMDHILGHLKEKMLNDGQLQKKLANYKLGLISDVIVEDDDKSLEMRLIFAKIPGPKSKQEERFQSKSKQEISRVEPPCPELKAERVKNPTKNPIRSIAAARVIASKYKDVKSKTDSNFGKSSTGGKSQKEELENSAKFNTRKDPFYESEEYKAEGTLKEWPHFSAEEDCERLRKAMKGLGTDEAAIIEVLGYRISRQRAQVVKLFKTMFGKDLLKELESELSGNFLTCCKSLCLPPPDFDASELRKAIKGLGTDEDVLIEIVCTRTNKQIQSIVTAYKQLFQRDLEKDLSGDTSGHFRKVLVAQVQGNRSEELTFDLTQVQDDVDELLRAGQDKWGTDESVFNKILCQRSFPHLRSLMKEYKKRSKKNASLQDSIRAEFSGDVKKALLTIVNVVEDKPRFFADKLHKAMKGLGTDDDALMRIVVSRCECDMVQIKQAFYEAYGKNLSDWIKDDISGDYLQIILALIGDRTPNPNPRSPNDMESNYSNAKKADDKDKDDNGDGKDDDDDDEEEDEEEEVIKKREPTLLPYANFDAKEDCEALRKAMKGLGTDEDAIIGVLTNRSVDQRVEVANMFKTMFGKDLIKELKSELSGNLSHVMTSLCKTRAQFAADELRKAMKGLGTDEDCLIDILCTKTNQELQDISSEFKLRHGKNLEDCLVSETSGHLKRLFVSLSQCNRPMTRGVKRAMARKDAKSLWQAGELKKFGTDESRFNVVLCSRSYAQLRATFEEYHKLSGKDFADNIKSEMSGDLKRALIAIVECIRDDIGFYARSLYDSMHGLGTNDDKLVRVIVSRSEIDMTQIKERFKINYKQTLAQYIKDDTSGDYRKSLLSLIGEK